MEEIASAVGLAFQIQDDILDVTSTSEALGKPVLSDEKNQKTTYVTLVGLEQAKKNVEEISARAVSLLKELPGNNAFLENLIAMLVALIYGGGIEILQANFFNRSGDVWDLVADVSGGIAGCLCYPIVKRFIPMKN